VNGRVQDKLTSMKICRNNKCVASVHSLWPRRISSNVWTAKDEKFFHIGRGVLRCGVVPYDAARRRTSAIRERYAPHGTATLSHAYGNASDGANERYLKRQRSRRPRLVVSNDQRWSQFNLNWTWCRVSITTGRLSNYDLSMNGRCNEKTH